MRRRRGDKSREERCEGWKVGGTRKIQQENLERTKGQIEGEKAERRPSKVEVVEGG